MSLTDHAIHLADLGHRYVREAGDVAEGSRVWAERLDQAGVAFIAAARLIEHDLDLQDAEQRSERHITGQY